MIADLWGWFHAVDVAVFGGENVLRSDGYDACG